MKRTKGNRHYNTFSILLAALVILPLFSQKKEKDKKKPTEIVKKEFRFKISKPASLFWTKRDGTSKDSKQAWVNLRIKRGTDDPVMVHFHAIQAKYYSEDKGIMEEREYHKKFFKEVKEDPKEGKKKFKSLKSYSLYTKGKNKNNRIFSVTSYIFKRKSFVYIYRVEGGTKALEKYKEDLKFIEKSLRFL